MDYPTRVGVSFKRTTTIVQRDALLKGGITTCREWKDEEDDDFTPSRRAHVRFKDKSGGSLKSVIEENSDDDFMPSKREHRLDPRVRVDHRNRPL